MDKYVKYRMKYLGSRGNLQNRENREIWIISTFSILNNNNNALFLILIDSISTNFLRRS